MVKMAKKEGLYVKSIKNGTVIDHIQSGMALNVLRILRVDGREGNVLSVVMNVPSKKMKTKDIVKIENRELKPAEVDKIALISPRATINIINEWNVVKKNNVKFQEVIRGIIKCNKNGSSNVDKSRSDNDSKCKNSGNRIFIEIIMYIPCIVINCYLLRMFWWG